MSRPPILILLSLLSVIIFQKSISFEIRQEFITATRFYLLMPCIDELAIDMVLITDKEIINFINFQFVDYLNANQNESLRIQEANRWLDKNWVNPSSFKSTADKEECDIFVISEQADKNWIRNQLITFIRQRSAIRIYLSFLFRGTRDLGYFNETEAAEMRTIFWTADKYNDNNFRLTESEFFHSANWRFEKTHYIPRKHFEILAWTLRLLPDYDKIYDWGLF